MATKYSTRSAARSAAEKAPIFRNKPTYVYKCTECECFHVGIKTDAPHHRNRTNCGTLGEMKMFVPTYQK